MSALRTTAAVVTAAALALPVAGCGEDKKQIPRGDARRLEAVLKTVQRQTDAKSCRAVEQTQASLERRVEALPSGVDGDVRSSLRDGVAHLRELVAGECTQAKKPKTESTETTTTEPTTTTESNTDTSTDTTTDTTTETNPDTNTDTTPQTTPDNGNTTPEGPPSGGAGVPPGQKKHKKGKR